MFAQETVTALMQGKATVCDYFVSVTRKWIDILEAHESKNTGELALIIEKEQDHFVKNRSADDWPLIKEIIGIVAIARFWTPNDDFGNREAKARQVRDAINQSHCSGEIKWSAEETAKTYGLSV
jgi:hypothetical protein